MDLSTAINATTALIQLGVVVGGAIWVSGKIRGKSEETDQSLADKMRRAEARLGGLEQLAKETHDLALSTDIEHKGHVRECDRRYHHIAETTERIEQRLETGLANLSAQITNIAAGRTGKIYEVRTPRTRRPPS